MKLLVKSRKNLDALLTILFDSAVDNINIDNDNAVGVTVVSFDDNDSDSNEDNTDHIAYKIINEMLNNNDSKVNVKKIRLNLDDDKD